MTNFITIISDETKILSNFIKKIGPLLLGSFGKYAGFHEIWQIAWPWNTADFMARWNLADFMVKSGRFNENLVDFMAMKSGRFHGKDLYICIGSDEKYSILVESSGVDFMVKSGRFHGHEIQQFHGKDLYICIGSDEKYSILVVDHEFHGKDLYTACIYLYSDEKYSILVVDHEICWISWNPADFMHEIWQFHHEIWWISSMKCGRFHGWSWKMQTWECKIL